MDSSVSRVGGGITLAAGLDGLNSGVANGLGLGSGFWGECFLELGAELASVGMGRLTGDAF